MAYELTIKKNASFQNPKLEALSAEMNKAIIAVGAMAEKTKVLCAKHLFTIDSEELYKDDGFESAVQFCNGVMGMSDSNAYAYIQVGRALELGQIPRKDANGKDFTFTQLRALCVVKSKDKLTEAVNSGDISADMSASEVEESAKALNPPKKARKPVAEKRYLWEDVGTGEESYDATKTEIITQIANDGGTFLGELKSDDDLYLVAIGGDGYPVLYRKGEEVKKVVDAK